MLNEGCELVVMAYCSIAAREIPSVELREMLQLSRKRNAWRGVTSLLAHQDQKFMQFIEGPREAVTALFQKIAADPRHTEITVMLTEPLPVRQFPDHAMAYRDLTDHPLPEAHRGLLEQGLRAGAFRDHPQRAHDLLHILADTRSRMRGA